MPQTVSSGSAHACLYSSDVPSSGPTSQSLIYDLDSHQLAEVVRRAIPRPDVGHMAADFIRVTEMSGRRFMNLKKQQLSALSKNDPMVTNALLRLKTAPQEFFAIMLSSIITEHAERNLESNSSQSLSGKLFASASEKDHLPIDGTFTLHKHLPMPGVGNNFPGAFTEANTLHASSEDSQQDEDVEFLYNDDPLVEEEKRDSAVVGTTSLIDTASSRTHPLPLQSTCTNDHDGICLSPAAGLTEEPCWIADVPQNNEGTGANYAENYSSADHDLHLEEAKGDVLGVDEAIAPKNNSEGADAVDTDVPATSLLEESSGAIDDLSNSTEIPHFPFVADQCSPVVPDMVDKAAQTAEAPVVDAATMCDSTPPATLGKVSQDAIPSELVNQVSSVSDEMPAVMQPTSSEGSPHDSVAISEAVAISDAENEKGTVCLSDLSDAEQSPSVDPESSPPALSVDLWDELPNSDDHFSKVCFILPIMPTSAHNWTEGANTILAFVEHPDDFDSTGLVTSTPRNQNSFHPLPSNTLEGEELVIDGQSAAEKDLSPLPSGTLSADDVDEWQSLLQVAPSGVTELVLTSVQSVQNEAAVSTSVNENEGLLINFSDKAKEDLSSVDIAQPSYNDLSEITMKTSEFSNNDAAAVPDMLDDDGSVDDDEPQTIEGPTNALCQLPRLNVDSKNWSLWDEISPCLPEDNPFSSSFTSSSRTLWPMNEGFSDSRHSSGAFENQHGVTRFEFEAKAGNSERLVSPFHTDASVQTDLDCQRELWQIQQVDLCRMASSPSSSPREPRSLQGLLPRLGFINRFWKIGVVEHSTAETSPSKVEVREDGVYPNSQGPLCALSP